MNAQVFPQRHRFSVQEYAQMGAAGVFQEDDRVELIEGEIFDMAPIGSKHAGIRIRLARHFILAVGERALVSVQNPIRLSGRSEPQPDLALLEPRADDYLDGLPVPSDVLLLIEVAESSLNFDRNIKIPLDARHDIPEVWLIDLAAGRIEIYRDPAASGYAQMRLAAGGEPLEPSGLPGIFIDAAGLLP